MPKETHLAARSRRGDVVMLHDSAYPSERVVEMFEKYHKGAAAELLEMVRADQRDAFTIDDRNSRLDFITRILGIVFAFLLTLCLILTGALLILRGHSMSGGSALACGIVSLVTVIAKGGRK